MIDDDLGRSGDWSVERPGFQRLVGEVCMLRALRLLERVNVPSWRKPAIDRFKWYAVIFEMDRFRGRTRLAGLGCKGGGATLGFWLLAREPLW
jgi:hypothetical protein